MKRILIPFSVLKYRDFRLYWIGFLLSRIGSEMQVVAVIWHLYSLTGSPLSLGLVGLSRFLPLLFGGFLSGIAADRYNRRNVMLLAQGVMTVCAVILTVTTFSGTISPVLIYILIAGNSVGGVLDTPARQSAVPHLVPKTEVSKAISLNTILWQSAIVIGPSISGFIIGFLGVGAVYLINAVSFLIIIAALLIIRIPGQMKLNEAGFTLSSLAEGLKFVFKTPIIYGTALLDFFATFFSSATVLLPIFAKEILAVGPTGLGLLYAAPSIGGIVTGLIVSSLKNLSNQGKILLSSILIYGLATIGFGFSRTFVFSFIFLALAGAGDIVSSIIRNTIRQMVTPDHLRGRMVSINMMFFMGGPQLGEVEAGLAAAYFGAPVSVIIGGVGTIIATTAIAFLFPKLRRYS